MNKEWREAETRYTIDRVLPDGTVQECFYGESWSDKALAETFMRNRQREYDERGRPERFVLNEQQLPGRHVYTMRMPIQL